jgi:hypothetical protein
MKKEVFNTQVKRLLSEYADKNFNMPKDRALQWYERFKDVSDDDFTATVGIVLDTCSYAPCMADLVKAYAQVREEKNNRAPKKWEGSR